MVLSLDPPPAESVWGRPPEWTDFPISAEPECPPPPPSPKRSRWPYVSGVVALLAVVAVVVAERSPTSLPPSPAQRLASAATRTQAAATARFTATAVVVAGGQRATVEQQSGQSNFPAHFGQYTVDSPMAPGARGVVRYVGDVSFIRYDALVLPPGAQWVQVDAAALTSPPVLAVLAGGDPTGSLQLLGARVGSPAVVGNDTVDGAPTTNYRIVLDLSGVLAKQGGAVARFSATLASALDPERAADLHDVAADVWLDGAGRVRRFDYAVNETVHGVATTAIQSVRMSGFGAPLTLDAPPTDQVVPFATVATQWIQLLTR